MADNAVYRKQGWLIPLPSNKNFNSFGRQVMLHHVSSQRAVTHKPYITNFTPIRFLPSVDPHMSHQILLPLQFGATSPTFETFFLRSFSIGVKIVDSFFVNSQVSFPRKKVPTNLALVGLLLVAFHVVPHVVESFEAHPADVARVTAQVRVGRHVGLQ